jgi:cytoskeleton-associated protein 5
MDGLFSVIQVSELEVEFEKVKGEKAVPSRYMKSQQQKQAKLAAEAAAAGNAEGENVTALVISRITSVIS